MRSRFVVLAAVAVASAAAMVPSLAGAAPVHNDGLTINATPNPIIAGQGVLIYGQLNGTNVADQPIVLYHRIAPRPFFTVIQRGFTNAQGFYEFARPELQNGLSVVDSNRQWYVVDPRNGSHSKTVSERVAALVSLSATVPNAATSTTATPTGTVDATTGRTVLFTGHVFPYHPFQRVLLQEQNANSANGSGWSTIARGFTGGGSNFAIPHRWAVPGDYTLRAVFPGDTRNITGDSDTVTVQIEQKQVADFTINSSAPIITDGQSVTISGVLDSPGTTTPEANTAVTLYSTTAGGSQPPVTVETGADGSYSFTGLTPANNTVYEVKATLKPSDHTAKLFEGVQDVVTVSAASSTGTVGGSDTFTGTVTPAHNGHLIYLQELGTDGYWHNVAATTVIGSTYSVNLTFALAGVEQYRARITGGPANIGAASSPVTVTVSGVAPVSTLPAS